MSGLAASEPLRAALARAVTGLQAQVLQVPVAQVLRVPAVRVPAALAARSSVTRPCARCLR
jgi:hypothetical protein